MSCLNYIIAFLLFTSFTACKVKSGLYNLTTVSIDSNISKEPIYLELDKQEELLSAGESASNFPRRSSDVTYLMGNKILDKKYPKSHNCRAYFSKDYYADTLIINIGFGSGFGGRGFQIYYKDQKFYTKPYRTSCIRNEDEVEARYKVINQKLILDKPEYNVGDSLYGKIVFEVVKKDNLGNSRHKADGYFRAKVKE